MVCCDEFREECLECCTLLDSDSNAGTIGTTPPSPSPSTGMGAIGTSPRLALMPSYHCPMRPITTRCQSGVDMGTAGRIASLQQYVMQFFRPLCTQRHSSPNGEQTLWYLHFHAHYLSQTKDNVTHVKLFFEADCQCSIVGGAPKG